jgi:hypothetical protein
MSSVYWVEWTGQGSGVGFTGLGTITTATSTVSVTYTNAQGIAFFQTGGGTNYWTPPNDATSPYTSPTVENRPPGAGIIALRFAGSQTLQFSQTIANPVFAFVSLNGNGYGFINQDFDILSFAGTPGKACGYFGCGNSFKEIIDLGGGNSEYRLRSTSGEPHGTIRFKGTFDTLTWNSLSAEDWNGFTVGIQGTAQEVLAAERAAGSVEGEDSTNGATRASANEYPEYRQASWNDPVGYTNGDQRHKARVWRSYDLPVLESPRRCFAYLRPNVTATLPLTPCISLSMP